MKTVLTVKKLRSDLLTAVVMNRFVPVINQRMAKAVASELTDFLRVHMTREEVNEMLAADEQRERSTIGMMRSGRVKVQPIKDLQSRIDKALSIIRLQYI